jgi:AcrR family transcriptional regulator
LLAAGARLARVICWQLISFVVVDEAGCDDACTRARGGRGASIAAHTSELGTSKCWSPPTNVVATNCGSPALVMSVSIVETSALVNGPASLNAVTPTRPHTGSRRNVAAEHAILRAGAELLAAGDSARITVAAIAERAGVGKQTIYRWWPSKSAVLLDAMIQRAEEIAPGPDSGNLQTDLRLFLRSTFAATPANRSLLLGVLREALGDAATMERLGVFTAARRDALAVILDRARARGQIASHERLDTVIDQAFGLLWYRMIFGHHALDDCAADEVAAALATQVLPSHEVQHDR